MCNIPSTNSSIKRYITHVSTILDISFNGQSTIMNPYKV